MIEYEKLLNWEFEDISQTYTRRDVMLYALGLGFGFNPTDPEELRFVYEKDLHTFPTMAVTLGHPGPWLQDPGTGIDMTRVLHGEQSLAVIRPLPVEASVIARNRVLEVIDKGADKGAVIITERRIEDADSGELYNTQQATIVARADGGFAGPVTSVPRPHSLPDREADARVDLPVAPQAALLYRLNGDYNPLHADVELARKVGFTAPILHGLASYGIAARAVLTGCDHAPADSLKNLAVRFSAPVYPGETLHTEIWRDGNIISFRTSVIERDVVVLNNGRAELSLHDE